MQLTVHQAATYLGVNETTVRRWIATRGLPAHRVNERLHHNAIELWEWATEHGIADSRRLLDRVRRQPDEVAPLSEPEMRGRLRGPRREVDDVLALMFQSASVQARLEGVGVVPKPACHDRGFVDPVARACEVPQDVRHDRRRAATEDRPRRGCVRRELRAVPRQPGGRERHAGRVPGGPLGSRLPAASAHDPRWTAATARRDRAR
jgi:excisionase family DNA binding protein